jgi:hypothetical protein
MIEMAQRTHIAEMLPLSCKAMYDVSIAVNQCLLTPLQKELIKSRASRLNENNTK